MEVRPQDLTINDFNYSLPDDRIAYQPLKNREDARLLVYKHNKIIDSKVNELPRYLPDGALMVFNNTRVIHARLLFPRHTGAAIEIFCLEPADAQGGYEKVLQSTQPVTWKCLVGHAAKWKTPTLESEFEINGNKVTLTATRNSKESGYFLITFSWSSNTITFGEVLHALGNIPLPPYIKRAPLVSDEERYQTVYAQEEGSVAAPTAGLHFTERLLQQLKYNGINQEMITLHVGAGTFKPVNANIMKAHEMHAEWMDVTTESISLLRDHDFIIPIGTTSLRTIESLYWMGVKASRGDEDLTLHQWEVYEEDLQHCSMSKYDALTALLNYLKHRKISRLYKQTAILIAPGYRFKIASALITNFHQPKSTLLLLVAAVVGKDWKMLYNHALNNGYRFLSYGDANLLFINQG